jgi:hypothetical protein
MKYAAVISLCVLVVVGAAPAAGCKRYDGQVSDTAAAQPTPVRGFNIGLKGYWAGAVKGDWIKYLTVLDNRDVIEVRTIKDFNQDEGVIYAAVERVYYDEDGSELKRVEKSFDLDEEYEMYEDLQIEKGVTDKKKKKVWDFETNVSGRKFKGALEVKLIYTVLTDSENNVTDINIHDILVAFYSGDVKFGGVVYRGDNSTFSMVFLEQGNIAESERKKPKPGDVKKAVQNARRNADIDKVIQEAVDNIPWPKGGEPVAVDKIDDIEDPTAPAAPEVLKIVDSLKGPYKGVRVGDWAKVLVRNHHIQVWTVHKIDKDSVHFRRRFYNNAAALYNIENATDSLVTPGLPNDGTVKERKAAVTLPTGKTIQCTIRIRQASMGKMCRMLSGSQPVGGGMVFSMFKETIYVVLLDWGRLGRTTGKAVKPGDVKKAKDALAKWRKNTLPKLVPELFQ